MVCRRDDSDDGPVTLLDQDEFDANRIAMGYPDEVVDTARQVANELFDWMTSGAEPFGVASLQWLERVRLEGFTESERMFE